jgi:uncharacterized damage-inducible protein DinB
VLHRRIDDLIFKPLLHQPEWLGTGCKQLINLIEVRPIRKENQVYGCRKGSASPLGTGKCRRSGCIHCPLWCGYHSLMSESEPLQILLLHDHWATGQILDTCRALTFEQFHQRFEMGPGSLHDTLTHIIGAMRTWTDTLAGIPLRPRIETDGQRRSPEQLRELLDESARALESESRRRPLDEMVIRTMRDGRTGRFTRGAVLTHVTTHGMHHRAQCLNMLRHLGIKTLPPSSVTEWTWRGEPEA